MSAYNSLGPYSLTSHLLINELRFTGHLENYSLLHLVDERIVLSAQGWKAVKRWGQNASPRRAGDLSQAASPEMGAGMSPGQKLETRLEMEL